MGRNLLYPEGSKTTKISKLKKGDIFYLERESIKRVYWGKSRVYNRNDEYMGWAFIYTTYGSSFRIEETFKDVSVVKLKEKTIPRIKALKRKTK